MARWRARRRTRRRRRGSPPTTHRRWVALVVCCSALFMTLLDVSVTNVALPSIGSATGAGPSELQWVVSGYTLAFGLVPVLAGRLGDDHGRRLMFQVGVAGFALTSVIAGLAPTDRSADRGARAPGPLRWPDQPAGVGARAADVPGRRARACVRVAGHDRRPRHRARAAGRRRPDRPRRARARLAAGVLHQRAGRDRGDRCWLAGSCRTRRPPAGIGSTWSARSCSASATFCVLFGAVRVPSRRARSCSRSRCRRSCCSLVFFRRERRLTREGLRPSGRPAAVPPPVVHLRRGAGAAVLPGDGRAAAGDGAVLPARAGLLRAARPRSG